MLSPGDMVSASGRQAWVALLVLGAVLVAAPCAGAATKAVTVAVTNQDSDRPLGFLEARLVLRDARVLSDSSFGDAGTAFSERRRRCPISGLIFAQAVRTRPGELKRVRPRARGSLPTTVVGPDGAPLGTAMLRWTVLDVPGGTDMFDDFGFAAINLPPSAAPGFRDRLIVAGATGFEATPRCRTAANRTRRVRVLGAIARSVTLRQTAAYVAPPSAAPPPTLDLRRAPGSALRVLGASEAAVGVGDLDGDGRGELVTAPGELRAGDGHIALGPSGAGTFDPPTASRGTVRLRAPDALASAAGVGDVTGDGFGDLLLGAPRANVPGRSDVGLAYLVAGRRSFPKLLDLRRRPGGVTTLEGAAVSQQAGQAVAAAGDFNGDGVPDFAIAAPDGAGDGRPVGAVYVVFGRRPMPRRIPLRTLGAGGLRIGGLEDGLAELALSGVGDVNGDGLGDVAVGEEFGGRAESESGDGRVRIVFGRREGGTVDLRRLGSAGVELTGGRCDQAGASVAGPGDVNGDGFTDVLIGAPLSCSEGPQAVGGAYVAFGGPGLRSGRLDQLGDRGLRIDSLAGSGAGMSVAAAGDDNADGLGDLLIGDPEQGRRGAVYVVHGRRAPGRVLLRSLGPGGRRVLGPTRRGTRGDGFGEQVAALPDADGDGRVEIIANADRSRVRGRSSGASFVVFSRGTGR